MGAEGVFIAGCGKQCARENTDFWVRQRVEKVRRVLSQISLEPERIKAFDSTSYSGGDAAAELDGFAERIGTLYIASILAQEVRN